MLISPAAAIVKVSPSVAKLEGVDSSKEAGSFPRLCTYRKQAKSKVPASRIVHTAKNGNRRRFFRRWRPVGGSRELDGAGLSSRSVISFKKSSSRGLDITLPPHCEVKPRAGKVYFTIFFLCVQGNSTEKTQLCHATTHSKHLHGTKTHHASAQWTPRSSLSTQQ